MEKFLQLLEPKITLLDFERSPRNLYDPIHYILSLGGKRIRPIMCLMACEMYCGDGKKALNQALAIELFHNFSLMHDDIMDKADLRRGKPTVHKKWDEAIGILSGDVMLVRSFQLLMDTNYHDSKALFDVFSQVTVQICEGQQMDMDFEKSKEVTVEEYLQMIKLKTAVLLAVSLKIGALIGGASHRDAEILYQFGINTGLAFQIKDDLLDVFGKQELVGKVKAGDIIANKKTFLWLTAWNNANTKQKTALSELQLEKNNQIKIDKTIEIYKDLNVERFTNEAIEKYYEKSIENLLNLSLPVNQITALKQLANDLLGRKM